MMPWISFQLSFNSPATAFWLAAHPRHRPTTKPEFPAKQKRQAAADEFTKAVKAYPKFAIAWYQLGLLRQKRNDAWKQASDRAYFGTPHPGVSLPEIGLPAFLTQAYRKHTEFRES
ncbi:MAG: hypothetical protein ACLQPN_09835 [Bryobacteraceae bacterium]